MRKGIPKVAWRRVEYMNTLSRKGGTRRGTTCTVPVCVSRSMSIYCIWWEQGCGHEGLDLDILGMYVPCLLATQVPCPHIFMCLAEYILIGQEQSNAAKNGQKKEKTAINKQ